MSDREWNQDVWSVLMDDGSEFLDVVIHQADQNKWPAVAARHKWTGPEYNGYRNQFSIWTALQRRGDIGPTLTFDRFLETIAAVRVEPGQQANPTQPPAADPGSVSP